MDYKEFIKTKIERFDNAGFDVSDEQLNESLFSFQKHAVKHCLKKGRSAVFFDCGLGKTFIQLEWSKHVLSSTGKGVLILAPLAVSAQTIQEGAKFGIEVNKYFEGCPVGVHITNYEQLKNLPDAYIENLSGIVLDESSILKNFTGKIRKLITERFKRTPYKLACTATPSPNDHNELGTHSEFLNILDAQDMRSRWFVRDDGMNNYRLKRHAEKDFFSWVSSWALMAGKPSDIGFSDEGYVLPSLNYNEMEVKTGNRENGKLFNDSAVSATTFNKELKLTINQRFDEVANLVNNSKEPFIVWVNQNIEADKACQMIPDAVQVSGSEKPEAKEKKLLGFANGDFRVLVTKKKIAQFGMNFQRCNNQVFASLDFSFEGLYQAIRRSYRFGQKKPVNIYIVTTDTMENVLRSIKHKQSQFEKMQYLMNREINQNNYAMALDYEFQEYKTDNVWLMKGDTTTEIDRIEDNSLDFSVFSPPFSSLFTYSNSWYDMGNNTSHEEFFKQYSFLLRKLYRKMKPGRLVAVHTKDLAMYKNSSGYTGIYDFTGEHRIAMEEAGFKLHCKIHIWTDPILEMQRTKTQRLLYKQLRKDSTYSGVGLPEFVYVFRKWEGDQAEWTPVNNKTTDNFPLDTWQKWASPTWRTEVDDIDTWKELAESYTIQEWSDIRRTDVLNNREGTDMGDEKHIAPLQISVIKRAIQMWTNPGETVFTPFLGIGSEAYGAVLLDRKAIGIELKDSYYDVAVKNVNKAVYKTKQPTLF